ncbi:hypothetical protein D8B26_002345 [Coccidioides posadasii str. Silveira]|uniref:uncharacterized protein n=1 Tax=Coccidioides posadasii (strain RMSCC 757 / Silveira) TaxID=443226 RepID=UPI001BEE319E|nr:hypothetical protein D8B26_002345 [Coccidioides posadasii str. Silveira]
MDFMQILTLTTSNFRTRIIGPHLSEFCSALSHGFSFLSIFCPLLSGVGAGIPTGISPPSPFLTLNVLEPSSSVSGSPCKFIPMMQSKVSVDIGTMSVICY